MLERSQLAQAGGIVEDTVSSPLCQQWLKKAAEICDILKGSAD